LGQSLIDLLKSLSAIREKSKEYGSWFELTTPKCCSARANAFNMIFNGTTLTFELLNYYFDIWNKPYPLLTGEKIEKIKRENAERVLEITKWAFIHALSIIEYCAKVILKTVDTEQIKQLSAHLQIKKGKKRVYLSSIMKKSRDAGLIDEEQYQAWKGLLEIRNTVIHNNAIADETIEYKISDIKIVFVVGEMLRGKLDTYIKLLDITVNLYLKWLETLLCNKNMGFSSFCSKN
jgi:uncharacterized protein YutE (UPF0331/DUF86 family)